MFVDQRMGLFGFFTKILAWSGTLMYAIVNESTGDAHLAIGLISLLFLLALVCFAVRTRPPHVNYLSFWKMLNVLYDHPDFQLATRYPSGTEGLGGLDPTAESRDTSTTKPASPRYRGFESVYVAAGANSPRSISRVPSSHLGARSGSRGVNGFELQPQPAAPTLTANALLHLSVTLPETAAVVQQIQVRAVPVPSAEEGIASGVHDTPEARRSSCVSMADDLDPKHSPGSPQLMPAQFGSSVMMNDLDYPASPNVSRVQSMVDSVPVSSAGTGQAYAAAVLLATQPRARAATVVASRPPVIIPSGSATILNPPPMPAAESTSPNALATSLSKARCLCSCGNRGSTAPHQAAPARNDAAGGQNTSALRKRSTAESVSLSFPVDIDTLDVAPCSCRCVCHNSPLANPSQSVMLSSTASALPPVDPNHFPTSAALPSNSALTMHSVDRPDTLDDACANQAQQPPLAQSPSLQRVSSDVPVIACGRTLLADTLFGLDSSSSILAGQLHDAVSVACMPDHMDIPATIQERQPTSHHAEPAGGTKTHQSTPSGKWLSVDPQPEAGHAAKGGHDLPGQVLASPMGAV